MNSEYKESGKLLTATEAAIFLKMSPTMFELYCEEGFIQTREDGKFLSDDLHPIIRSWECDHYTKKYYDSLYADNGEFYNSYKESFSKYIPYKNIFVGKLVQNYFRCNPDKFHASNGINYINNISNMLAPHIVSVKPMTAVADWFFNLKRRCIDNNSGLFTDVIESESVSCKTRTLEYLNLDESCDQVQLLKDIDGEVVRDISGNALTYSCVNSINDINIQKVIETIKGKANAPDAKCWAIYPPELIDSARLTGAINPRAEQNELFYKHYGKTAEGIDVYLSRHVCENEILVGVKSEMYKSYILAPYCLSIYGPRVLGRAAPSETFAVYAKRLLREGSQVYGKIKYSPVNKG